VARSGGETDLHHIGFEKRITRLRLDPGYKHHAIAVHPTVPATLPILTKPLAWAAQGASSVKQATDQSVQFLADGVAWVVGFINAVWAWTGDQIVRMTQAPWESWPLWKQILLIVVAGFVVYALFIAAKQLWWSALNVLSALAGFIGTLIVTLPAILLAGAIALAGLWFINNFHDLSSLRPIMTSPGGDGGSPDGRGSAPGPATRQGPGETTGGR
jgi:hypothetical protein